MIIADDYLLIFHLLIQIDKCIKNRAQFMNSDSQEIYMEKQKAMILLYCLIQFRNGTARIFNVFYMLAARAIFNKYKHIDYFISSSKNIIDILNMNIPLDTINEKDFFSAEAKTVIENKGILYLKAVNYCKSIYSKDDISEPNTGLKNIDDVFKKAKRPTISPSILTYFETEKMNQAYDIVIDSVSTLPIEFLFLSFYPLLPASIFYNSISSLLTKYLKLIFIIVISLL